MIAYVGGSGGGVTYACPGGPRVCGLDAHMLDAHLREAPAAPRVRARRVRRGPASLRPCGRVHHASRTCVGHRRTTDGTRSAHCRRSACEARPASAGGARVGRDARSDGAQLPHVALTCRLRPRGGLAWVVIAVLAATLATRCSRCSVCSMDAMQQGRNEHAPHCRRACEAQPAWGARDARSDACRTQCRRLQRRRAAEGLALYCLALSEWLTADSLACAIRCLAHSSSLHGSLQLGLSVAPYRGAQQTARPSAAWLTAAGDDYEACLTGGGTGAAGGILCVRVPSQSGSDSRGQSDKTLEGLLSRPLGGLLSRRLKDSCRGHLKDSCRGHLKDSCRGRLKDSCRGA
jgi:hypothetical protein